MELNTNQPNGKRTDYLSWDEYFMSIALLSSMRSKDPVTQVGACIINQDKKIVGIGYNGMPTGLSDDEMPWGKSSDNQLENKYFFVCHAELNAVLNRNHATSTGCILYATMFPCNECAKVLIQAGIKEVIYFSDKKKGTPANEASKTMFTKAGILFRQFQPTGRQIHIDLSSLEKDE
ncbi:Cytidine and deoxycytidylate deaminase zinc-binding region [Fasciolopsis buskii]|uniref:dCMP deaminase n=1 Tax=Fasciolopsis buskii TaxID=27845 RepID=A0A8E0VPS6_9TREM|nr:Cytidine and deoxycytidylate deaminase zinc-binding region [Fasciolopsis buski]